MKHIGTIEIKQENGEFIYTEVCKSEGKLITGTPTNSAFLRDEWEVSLEEFNSQDEALEALYEMIEESSRN
jgi:hypothetical protein